jgi:hypothetical protein
MDARRRIMEKKRTSPDEVVRPRLTIRADGSEYWSGMILSPEHERVPAQIWIHLDEPSKNAPASSELAPVASWDFPRWLEQAQAKWGGYPIDLVFVSFGTGFMKPELIEHLQTLAARRLRWSSKLLTDGLNLTSTAAIDALLRSSLDEVIVYVAGVGEAAINARVLQVTKDLVDLRAARGQNRPNIICRICPNPAGGQKIITEMSQWVRQAGIDRLEVSDKVTEEKRLWGS